MDRRVKERLIGASILVALAVLVVPELLSGPKPSVAPAPTLPAAAAPEPIRNVTVDLTTSKAPANSEVEQAAPEATSGAANSSTASVASTAAGANVPAAQTAAPSAAPVSTPSAASIPAPRASAASNSAPSSASTKAPIKQPAARRVAVESAAASPTSNGHGSWSVQLGSFASRANADNLTRQVKGQGFAVFVLPGGSGSAVRYRVRVGPLSDRESAERMAAKLKSLGHAGSLVSPAA
jgi:DedD protein